MRRRNYLERDPGRLYYTLAELERLTGLNRSRIYSLERMGFIRAKVRNGRRFYGPEDFRKLVDFKALSDEYPPDVIVRSYEELKLRARIKRCRNEILRLRNRIRRFLKVMEDEGQGH